MTLTKPSHGQPPTGPSGWEARIAAAFDEIDSLSATRSTKLELDYRDYGIVADVNSAPVATANRTALNQVLTDARTRSNLASPIGTSFRLPPGTVFINDAIDALGALTADQSMDLSFGGVATGRGSRIYQIDNTKDVFKLSTSTGNLRGLNFHDFSIWFGKRQFWLDKVLYSRWHNVNQRAAAEYAIYAEGSSYYNRFSKHWIYETGAAGDAVYVGSSDLDFTDSTFGENTGAIYANGGSIYLHGCRMFGGQAKGTPAGIGGDGPAMIQVNGSGSKVIINGGTYEPSVTTPADIFYFGGSALSVTIAGGTKFLVPAGYSFAKQRLALLRGFQMTGCRVEFSGDGSLLDLPTSVVPHDWSLIGNTLIWPTANTVTVDTKLVDGTGHNVFIPGPIVRI